MQHVLVGLLDDLGIRDICFFAWLAVRGMILTAEKGDTSCVDVQNRGHGSPLVTLPGSFLQLVVYSWLGVPWVMSGSVKDGWIAE